MRTNLKFIMIALFTIAISSCSPEDGKDGEQGIPGQDGNANVTSYLFKNVVLEDGISEPFDAPAVTEDILNNGAVLGYMRGVNTIEWYPLPFLVGDVHISIYAIIEGALVISSNTQTNPLDLRIVVIKGNPENGGKSSEGKSASQAIYDELKTAGVEINDYNAVMNFYKIKN